MINDYEFYAKEEEKFDSEVSRNESDYNTEIDSENEGALEQ